MQWVLDWDRVGNLFVVLLPFFLAIGGGFKYLVDRSDRRRHQDDEERDEQRRAELDEMRAARQAFYGDILREAQRMRELYEAELGRAIALRTALAEAAQREHRLQETVMELNRKIDRLQDEVAELRRELERERGRR